MTAIIVTVLLCLPAAFLLVLAAGVLLAKARVGPFRFGTRRAEEVRRAAEEDVAAVRRDDRYFRRRSPGAGPDDL
ncbi:hypothetical protein ACFVH6_41535 [Spirillospora sp. NPDC127200]